MKNLIFNKLKNKKKIIIATLVLCIIIIIGAILIFSKSDNPIEKKNKEINQEITKAFEMEDGVIGYLIIDKIGLNAPIKEGTDLATLNNYVGHFEETALLDGNVSFAGHNRGYEKNWFENLDKLQEGDVIIYKTKFDEKKYQVKTIKTIKDTDTSVLNGTEDNRLTLITCIADKDDYRLCIQAIEEGKK